ncbi:DUF6682 family protein [Yoonia sp.]|uniref:phage adaptor protein n=1 Tax=Yoonia sp. TaxID=2212373 RepID=UPI002E03F4B9|nr:DUF6682 family protein [Yoonia sp.]
MAFTAASVMLSVQTVLNDATAVRWTAVELHTWLNDALREIAVLKPNAVAKTVELDLQQGAYQTLPEGHFALFRLTRNLATNAESATGRGGGRVITKVEREVMDMQISGWMDNAVMPYTKNVVHFIDDISDMAAYYVVPGNDGTGVVEAICAVMPTLVPAPETDTLMVSSYTSEVDISDIYRNAIIDYMLYRAFSKDASIAGIAQRAGVHYSQFANSLGLKFAAERLVSGETVAPMGTVSNG